MQNSKYKQIDVFYASKSSEAKLIKEKIQWPVRLAYNKNITSKFFKKIIDFLGKYITNREAKFKNSKDPVLVKKFINYYLNFYKDFINMHEFNIPEDGFKTFNDWFIRSLKDPDKSRPLEDNKLAIVSPADCKILILPDISLHTQITIKEEIFDLEAFLQDKKLAETYNNGSMIIFRLAPYDYHRYHFPFDSMVSQEIFIDGKYHSVNPRAFICGVKPLTVNKRSYEILTPAAESENYNNIPVVMIQVGATAVASIVNCFENYSKNNIFLKGQEMGYFQFGGSTLVMLFPKNRIIFDEQIVKNSLNGYETAVKVRETIAYWSK